MNRASDFLVHWSIATSEAADQNPKETRNTRIKILKKLLT